MKIFKKWEDIPSDARDRNGTYVFDDRDLEKYDAGSRTKNLMHIIPNNSFEIDKDVRYFRPFSEFSRDANVDFVESTCNDGVGWYNIYDKIDYHTPSKDPENIKNK